MWTEPWSMPVATQNKITRSCALSFVVGFSIVYPAASFGHVRCRLRVTVHVVDDSLLILAVHLLATIAKLLRPGETQDEAIERIQVRRPPEYAPSWPNLCC